MRGPSLEPRASAKESTRLGHNCESDMRRHISWTMPPSWLPELSTWPEPSTATPGRGCWTRSRPLRQGLQDLADEPWRGDAPSPPTGRRSGRPGQPAARVATFRASRYATDASRPPIRGRFRLRHADDRGQGFESPLAPKRFCGSSATFSAVRQFAAGRFRPRGMMGKSARRAEHAARAGMAISCVGSLRCSLWRGSWPASKTPPGAALARGSLRGSITLR